MALNKEQIFNDICGKKDAKSTETTLSTSHACMVGHTQAKPDGAVGMGENQFPSNR